MKVWGVFRGYSGAVNGMSGRYVEDEWLCDLYMTEQSAREAVLKFGEGKGFDDNQETQITRYFKRGKTIFDNGEETETFSGGNSQWARIQELIIRE